MDCAEASDDVGGGAVDLAAGSYAEESYYSDSSFGSSACSLSDGCGWASVGADVVLGEFLYVGDGGVFGESGG